MIDISDLDIKNMKFRVDLEDCSVRVEDSFEVKFSSRDFADLDPEVYGDISGEEQNVIYLLLKIIRKLARLKSIESTREEMELTILKGKNIIEDPLEYLDLLDAEFELGENYQESLKLLLELNYLYHEVLGRYYKLRLEKMEEKKQN